MRVSFFGKVNGIQTGIEPVQAIHKSHFVIQGKTSQGLIVKTIHSGLEMLPGRVARGC